MKTYDPGETEEMNLVFFFGKYFQASNDLLHTFFQSFGETPRLIHDQTAWVQRGLSSRGYHSREWIYAKCTEQTEQSH